MLIRTDLTDFSLWHLIISKKELDKSTNVDSTIGFVYSVNNLFWQKIYYVIYKNNQHPQ